MEQLRQFSLVVAVALLLLVAVYLPLMNGDDGPQATETFRGYYYEGLETSNFFPCELAEMWWILPGEAFLSREYRRITGSQAMVAVTPPRSMSSCAG